MTSLPKEARTSVQIDEAKVARGILDSSSLVVTIDWRKPEEIPSILAELEKLPPPMEDKLACLELADGKIVLLPEAMLDNLHKLSLSDGTSYYELARQSPEEYLHPALHPAVAAATEYALGLIRAHLPDFDAYPAQERAEFLISIIKDVDEVRARIERLGKQLALAQPGKKRPTMPLEESWRDVKAAILRDVYGLGSIRVGEQLGMAAEKDWQKVRQKAKRENQNASNAIRRGREVLERDFGEEGWRTKAERMREMWLRFKELRLERIEKWETLGPKQRFYALLAEYRMTSPEEEESAAKRDEFDKVLERWMSALERGQFDLAVSIERSDPRFDDVRGLLREPPGLPWT